MTSTEALPLKVPQLSVRCSWKNYALKVPLMKSSGQRKRLSSLLQARFALPVLIRRIMESCNPGFVRQSMTPNGYKYTFYGLHANLRYEMTMIPKSNTYTVRCWQDRLLL